MPVSPCSTSHASGFLTIVHNKMSEGGQLQGVNYDYILAPQGFVGHPIDWDQSLSANKIAALLSFSNTPPPPPATPFPLPSPSPHPPIDDSNLIAQVDEIITLSVTHALKGKRAKKAAQLALVSKMRRKLKGDINALIALSVSEGVLIQSTYPSFELSFLTDLLADAKKERFEKYLTKTKRSGLRGQKPHL